MLQVHATSRDGCLRLAPQPELMPCVAPSGTGIVLGVDTSRRFQTIEGFGGAFTEAAAVNWQALSPGQRDAALRAYFAEPGQGGHGYSLCRVHMGSCDFSLDNYAHVEVEGDVELRSFSIERDRRALLALLQAAGRVAARAPRVIASPWSPPAWMKDSGRMNGGGRLLESCRDAWAGCFVRFVQAYREQGVDIWGVTVQNEPMVAQTWDSCVYSAEEERDFIARHLGPAFDAAGLRDVRIIGWDHNRDLLAERARVLYADERARAYLWGLGFHWYGEPMFDNVRRVHEAWPDKKLLLTEACQEGGPHRDSWEVAERYAESMLADLNHGSVGWIDWNLFLDMQGGPNHAGNLCSAPILVDAQADQWFAQPSYFYIGHVVRHVRPGARRVFCAPSSSAVQAAAFEAADGRLALVAMNRNEHALELDLRIDAQAYRASLPARSIATYVRGAASEQPRRPS